MLKKRNKDDWAETNDILIVFDDEKKTSDIKRINKIDSETIWVDGIYKIPLLDCEVTNSEEGRNFFYRAPSESIRNVRRIAELEKTTVLQQITSFKPAQPPKPNLMVLGLFIMMGIELIVIAVK